MSKGELMTYTELKHPQRILVELIDYGHALGMGIGNEHGDSLVCYRMPIDMAQELMNGLWTQGLRPERLHDLIFKTGDRVELVANLVADKRNA